MNIINEESDNKDHGHRLEESQDKRRKSESSRYKQSPKHLYNKDSNNNIQFDSRNVNKMASLQDGRPDFVDQNYRN